MTERLTARCCARTVVWVALAAASCGSVPGDVDPDGSPIGADADNQTQCSVAASPTNTLVGLSLTTESNGVTCSVRVGNGAAQAIDCTGLVTVANPGLGRHRIVLTVRSGPGGAAECESYVVVRYPGFCTLELDDDANGAPNRKLTRIYDPVGRIVRDDVDNNLDTIIDGQHVYTYADDHIVHAVLDNPLGAPAEITLDYAYDGDGRLLQHQTDRLSDGVVNEIGTYIYDAAGRLIRREDDEGGPTGVFDGVADDIHSFLFGADGFVSRIQRTGNTVSTQTFTRDELGQVTLDTIDNGSDGSIESRNTYLYDCW